MRINAIGSIKVIMIMRVMRIIDDSVTLIMMNVITLMLMLMLVLMMVNVNDNA